jgi:uncharacterized protein (DUF58 family)
VPGRFSGLTTRGRCLVAGGLATGVCAVVLDERDLLRVGVFAAALPVLALLLAARTRRNLRVTRELTPRRLPVGTDVTVTLRLTGGPLLATLRLGDTVPDGAGLAAAAPPRFVVHRLGGRGGAALDYPLCPQLRGVHRVGPLLARVTDPLGLAEFERELAPSDPLVVLPRVLPLHGLPLALAAGEGTAGAALSHQGQGASDVLVRTYRQGDELRRVHWRSTARHDELMVRLEERPWRGNTTVLLDRRDGAHRGHGPASSLEFAVSLVASICAHLAGRGEPFALVGEDGTELAAARDIDAVLDALAAVRPTARGELSPPGEAAGGDLIAVLAAGPPGEFGALAGRPGGGHAVVLDSPTWEPARPGDGAGPAAAALRAAGWHVAVAAASSTPGRAWDDLVAAGNAGPAWVGAS